jgi:hypothetical protein
VGGQSKSRDVSGFHDPLMRVSVNFYGAPVLSLQDFAGYQQDLLIGASVQVSPPLGQYESDKMVNLGNNRWSVKPEIGTSKAWGKCTLELSTGMIFFTDNEDYYGGRKLVQDPVSSTQMHAIYSFGKGIWASVSANYDYGGRTTVNGVLNDDLQSNSRIGATFAMPLNRNNSIKLYANTGLSTHRGKDYTLTGVAWQYRWGDGL